MGTEKLFDYDTLNAPTVGYDTYSHAEITLTFEENYKEVLYDARNEMLAAYRLKEQVAEWQRKDSPTVVVMTSGVYDLLHHDHKGYLLHTKLTGLPVLYEKLHGTLWHTLNQDQQVKFAHKALMNDALKLVVSVDGDESVANRKGGVTEKGGAPRPITGWETRAKSVADVTVPLSTSSNSWVRKPVADAVTIHGPEDFPQGHINYSLISLAEHIQPDAWAIYEESQDILSEVPYHPSLGGIALKCIPYKPGVTYFADPIIGRFSTTSIVKRATGEL